VRCITITVRLQQLDALRGVAAFSVVIDHCLGVFPFLFGDPGNLIAAILSYSPLHLFWSGHEAVMLFFVLSGFVLSLPYFKGKQLNYPEYIIKRIFRIYLPYVASLLISVLLLQMLSEHGIAGLSTWFNAMWKNPPTTAGWINLLLMLNTQEAHNINTTTWTLIYEMHISIILPLLAYFVKRVKWTIPLCLPILLIFSRSNFIHYSSFFLLGCLLAKYHDFIISYIANCKKTMVYTFYTIGSILYLFEWLTPFTFNQNIFDLFTSYGAAIFIALALGDSRAKNFLLKPQLIYLGNISYSLYLVHPIVLLTAIYSLKNVLPIYLIVLMVPFISIFIAHFYNKLVENPAVALGQKIIKKNFGVYARNTLIISKKFQK
jgi:peptidoglycan/LPS O-acetylase OafA/YrhL